MVKENIVFHANLKAWLATPSEAKARLCVQMMGMKALEACRYLVATLDIGDQVPKVHLLIHDGRTMRSFRGLCLD